MKFKFDTADVLLQPGPDKILLAFKSKLIYTNAVSIKIVLALHGCIQGWVIATSHVHALAYTVSERRDLGAGSC